MGTRPQPLNAVIGDAGFHAALGRAPTAHDSDQIRIRTHLSYVIERLRMRRCDDLPEPVRARRERCIALLETYRDAGAFPQNTYQEGRVPVFVDADGRLCAVGYLIARTTGLQVSLRIASTHRLGLIEDIDLPIVDTWAAEYGFDRSELAMIQPTYGWEGMDTPTAIDPAVTIYHWVVALGFFPAVTAVVAYLFAVVRDQVWDRRVFFAAIGWGVLCYAGDMWAIAQGMATKRHDHLIVGGWDGTVLAVSIVYGFVLIGFAAAGLASWDWQDRARKVVMGMLLATTLGGFVSLVPWDTELCGSGERTWDTRYGYLFQVSTPFPPIGDMQVVQLGYDFEEIGDAIGPAVGCSGARMPKFGEMEGGTF